jgi:hypothetical protein
MGQDVVGLGIFGFNFNCIFGALIGGVEVSTVFVELRYGEILGDALIVGLEVLDLGEFTTRPRAGGAIGPGRGL